MTLKFFFNFSFIQKVAGLDLINEKQSNHLENEKQHQNTSNMLDLNAKINNFIKKKQVESPMEKLISMGFANRTLNDRLLKKYNHDMEKVIKDLIERISH